MDNYEALERELIKSINKLSRKKISKPLKSKKGITSLLKLGEELKQEIKLNNHSNNNSSEPNKKTESSELKERQLLSDYEKWLKDVLVEIHKPICLVLATGEKFSLENYL